MKTLLLIRHAKSSWASTSLSDFDRTLNERGLRDAPMMAERLNKRNLKVDALVSSTANRAFSTAFFFAEVLGFTQQEIIKKDKLYHATSQTFNSVISELESEKNVIAIFSHNPGISDFVNELTTTKINNMPTCAIFGVSIHSNNWNEFSTAKKEFLFFDYPKSI